VRALLDFRDALLAVSPGTDNRSSVVQEASMRPYKLLLADPKGRVIEHPWLLATLRSDGFAVIESRSFAETRPACRYASQSGPMVVIDGALHPRFSPTSDSLHYRNGVGVTEDGHAHFVISNEVVNFHSFARFFRDVLNTPNALFFDGSVSRLYAPMLERHDAGFPMGPMIGVVTDLTTVKD
jgi:prepilin-type processing-associated H-X9-DG protein